MAKKGQTPRSPLPVKRRRIRGQSDPPVTLAATPAHRAASSQRPRHRKAGNGLAAFGTFISTLARGDIRVLKPIPVTFEREEDGSYVASFLDAGVSSGGETLRDATWSLQEMIAASFQTLRQMTDRELGPKMRRQRDVLLEFLCPSSRKPTQRTPRKS